MDKLIHLDLKGAAPVLSYFEKVFPLFSKWGATGILIEYEDMFPYEHDLSVLRNPTAYTTFQIGQIISLAQQNGLKIIPLVQIMGHLEFVLKQQKFYPLREQALYPNALCPEHPDSFQCIIMMIEQVLQLHPHIKFLHLGADEVWHMGRCEKCTEKMNAHQWDLQDLYLYWIRRVSIKVKETHPNIQLIMWDDMIRSTPIEKLKAFEIGSVVQPMLWKYEATSFDFPAGMFDRYSLVFDEIWIASCFKGATGCTQFLPPIQHHINNHLTWLQLIKDHKSKFKDIKGIALTGWQRYDHYAVLCELLPVAIPSLALCLRTLVNGAFTENIHETVSKELGFTNKINVHPFPRPQPIEQGMTFPGQDLYTAVQIWSNLVCRYQVLCNSEGMLGWFSDYFRSKNFTNPAQVENILYPMLELNENLLELQKTFEKLLLKYFYKDTLEEWTGCFFKSLLDRIETVVKDCRNQIRIAKKKIDLDPANS